MLFEHSLNLRYLALSRVIADVMNLSLNIIHGHFLFPETSTFVITQSLYNDGFLATCWPLSFGRSRQRHDEQRSQTPSSRPQFRSSDCVPPQKRPGGS